tara:strand:+ start:6004 stop:7167 length:1164 start_codon:yes stop_codon:yes gene_type:complete
MFSCELPDNNVEYQEGLVVFGRIELFEINGTSFGEIDTLRVSLSSSIDANLENANQLYINDANVSITGLFDEQNDELISTIQFISLNEFGKYYIDDEIEYKIWPNKEYTINVNYNDYEVAASTITPDYLSIESIEDNYNCEECSDPSIYGETTCENAGETWNSELQNIQEINIDNFDLINNQTNGTWIFNTDVLESFISDGTISSIDLSRYGCTVGSFASKPYFVLNIEDEESGENVDPSAIRILTYALEPERMGLEPSNSDGTYFDYNENNIQDMTLINTFYDTTAVFDIWKGPYFRDENYNPYLLNPFIWTVETSPTPIMWLYFNYYGKHLVVVQSSDDAYYDYLSGDPLGQNQYIIPDSNIEGGYGLFTSNYSKAFFLNIRKAD